MNDELYMMIIEGFNEMGGEQYEILSESKNDKKTKSALSKVITKLSDNLADGVQAYIDWVGTFPLTIWIYFPIMIIEYNRISELSYEIPGSLETKLKVLRGYKRTMEYNIKIFKDEQDTFDKKWGGMNRGMMNKLVSCCETNLPKIQKKIDMISKSDKTISESTVTFEEWLGYDY